MKKPTSRRVGTNPTRIVTSVDWPELTGLALTTVPSCSRVLRCGSSANVGRWVAKLALELPSLPAG
jgi:hypothetical protein